MHLNELNKLFLSFLIKEFIKKTKKKQFLYKKNIFFEIRKIGLNHV